MVYENFLEWKNKKDIFGFGSISKEKKRKLDLKPINSDVVINELSKLLLGTKRGKTEYYDSIIWGNKEVPGAIMLDISPLGSYKAIARKLIRDMEGNNTWICKFVFNFNEGDSKEEAVAMKIYENLSKIDLNEDSAHKNFKDLEKYVVNITGNLRRNVPKVMFYDKLKKIYNDYYICLFDYRGHGVEAPGSSRAEQFHIHFKYVESKGLVRSWGNEISSPTKRHLWMSQPSEWDEYFAPTQSHSEISRVLVNMFSAY